MSTSLTIVANKWLIAAFGIASGLYKVFGGQADIELLARLGMAPMVVAAFGAVQAAAGAALLVPHLQRPAAFVLAAANALASYALFVGGVQPFGIISLAFIAMALLAARRPSERVSTRRATPGSV